MADDKSAKRQRILIFGAIALLWLGSLALGVFLVLVPLPVLAEEIIGMLPEWGIIDSRVRLDGLYRASRWTILVGGGMVLMVVFASGEYHLKHAGNPKSWRLFKWTYGIEIALGLLCFLGLFLISRF